jgi:hypothetical protein
MSPITNLPEGFLVLAASLLSSAIAVLDTQITKLKPSERNCWKLPCLQIVSLYQAQI